MKHLPQLAAYVVYTCLFSISMGMTQNAVPVLKQKANKFEYGHFENNRQDMMVDTTLLTTVEISIYADSLLIDSKTQQKYLFAATLNKDDYKSYYDLSVDALDQDGDICNVLIHHDKIHKTYKITIAYNNIFIIYYL
jgi:hypothetical protein